MNTLTLFFKPLLVFALTIVIAACSSDKGITQDEIIKSYAINLLKDETYYFPARKFQTDDIVYQPLKRFDIIFTAYDVNSSKTTQNSRLISQVIPGDYTHMLMYIGKDSEGFAYGVEMNSNISEHIQIGTDGLELGGRLYLYCLGSDYGDKSCPKDNYIYGLERYDYLWAKSLTPQLYQQLKKSENKFLQRIKEDLISAYPFKIQFYIGKSILETKEIQIIHNRYQDGGDCASYFIGLFENIAHICLKDVRMDARTLEEYYLNDTNGQQAYIPMEYNLFSKNDINLKYYLERKKYSFRDNKSRESKCSSGERIKGFVTPDLIFNSSSMEEIKGVSGLGL